MNILSKYCILLKIIIYDLELSNSVVEKKKI